MNEIQKSIIHGRRIGKPLSNARQDAIENLLPILKVPDDDSINPSDLFGGEVENFALEIGFGDGNHLLEQTKRHPNCGFFGAEPYLNGMANFLRMLPKQPHNIRVTQDSALDLVARLPDACLDKIYVLNPDPWPKKRHHKRRIINQNNLDEFARVLKDGGKLIMTTDVDDLAQWMVTHAINHKSFHWDARSKKDWQIPPKDWFETKYEKLGKDKGRKQTYLFFTTHNRT